MTINTYSDGLTRNRHPAALVISRCGAVLATCLFSVSLATAADLICTVRQSGKPVKGGNVTLVPDNQPAASLKADPQGHFRGTVLVNNIPMPFLVDTGTTKTVLPVKMATAAGLPFGQVIEISTAGGKAAERVTRIPNLKIGNAELTNVDAYIGEHLDEVLIGINTLKYFHLTQDENTLTLVANNQEVHQVTNPQGFYDANVQMQQSATKPTTVKKTVSCDTHEVCKTTYSDH